MARKVIVHVINGLATGGAEMMLFKLLSGADRTRFEPVVISLLDKGTIGPRIEALGVRVFTLNMLRGVPSLRSLVHLCRILQDVRPDLLQGWMYHSNLAATLAKWLIRSKVPLLWNMRHSLYEFSQEPFLTRRVIRLCARASRAPRKIIYNSSISATQHEAHGFNRVARLLIPNGFDTDTFRPDAARRASIRGELGIPESVRLIGLVARYHPIKGHKNFLAAAATVAKQYSNVRFLLVGRSIDDAEGPVAREVRSLDIQSRVMMLGERSDIASINAALDIAVSSSSSEAFPNAIGEAMACGVPCVVTDVGDSRSLVGDTGIAVQPRDPRAMAQALGELLDMDPIELEKLGVAARERIVTEFSLERIVEKYEAVYDALC